MVSIRERVFLVSGNDFIGRRHTIENIKKRILKDQSHSINTLTFRGKEIDIKDLRDSIFVKSFGKDKIVIFKNLLDLSSLVMNFLLDNLKKILSFNYLILETDKDYYQIQHNKRFSSSKFFNSIIKNAALFRVTSSRKRVGIEDFINSIRNNNLVSSLYILEEMHRNAPLDKSLGPKVIGILTRKFSYLNDFSEKDRCFKYLWQADRAIKEKGLDTHLTIQTLLVKLFERN